MSKVKVYYDLMSQPCRSLIILLEMTKYPHEKVEVALRKGEQYGEPYKDINRFQKVPCIVDNGFKLAESIAILNYLDNKHSFGEQLYPKDSKLRARIDEYLQWQHNNTRLMCSTYFQYKWLIPSKTGKEPRPDKLADFTKRMADCLDIIENVWLAGDKKFLVSDTLNVADIWAACELDQPRMAGYEPTDGRPKMKTWFDRVRSSLAPYYGNAHQITERVIAKSKL